MHPWARRYAEGSARFTQLLKQPGLATAYSVFTGHYNLEILPGLGFPAPKNSCQTSPSWRFSLSPLIPFREICVVPTLFQ